jgi:hypothetical protein
MMAGYAPFQYRQTSHEHPELPSLQAMAARRDSYLDARRRAPVAPALSDADVTALMTPGSTREPPTLPPPTQPPAIGGRTGSRAIRPRKPGPERKRTDRDPEQD